MISVIVPVYNVETYLERCIRSILTNTYKDLEIICVNDGSKDSCLKILECLAKEDSRIRIINQENQGVEIARNTGIKESRGDYIAFIDSDDLIHPQYFETLLNCMEKKSADVVICGCQPFFEKEKLPLTLHKHIPYIRLSSEQFFKSYYARHMVWGRLFRKKDLEGLWFVPGIQYSEDTLYNLTVMASLNNPKVYETSIPLYFYLQRSDSITKTSNYQKLIQLPDWVVNNPDKIAKHDWSWMLELQALKMALSYRYGSILHKKEHETRHANKVIQVALLSVIKDRRVCFSEKMIHVIMVLFPRVYRAFRIKDDPTLLDWEQRVRKEMS